MDNELYNLIHGEYVLIKKQDIIDIVNFYNKQKLLFPYSISICDTGYHIVKNGKGKKPKKYNRQQVEEISKSINDIGIRKTALKYDSSTKLIQAIKKGKYIPND
ncbi:hypothetical protein [Clostridium cylindrosporum]|uniref:Uncharacterized protein n=1 Tax=Clostridium cylindrosporum DSM 605 TaxID=1121307 RepID=A0A0J8D8E3_CLOCY|nr:hypothetical protein [Clostridium cylindrosporum]KMT22325.1 hypothetical protein CLCY_16c00040 [Clostridium cylindrosporum DSM 605]